MLVQDQLKPAPTLVLPDGLAGVERGFQYLKEGKVSLDTWLQLVALMLTMPLLQVSAQKIVFRIADTPGINLA